MAAGRAAGDNATRQAAGDVARHHSTGEIRANRRCNRISTVSTDVWPVRKREKYSNAWQSSCRHTLLMEAVLGTEGSTGMAFVPPWHDTATLQRLSASAGQSLADRSSGERQPLPVFKQSAWHC